MNRFDARAPRWVRKKLFALAYALAVALIPLRATIALVKSPYALASYVFWRGVGDGVSIDKMLIYLLPAMALFLLQIASAGLLVAWLFSELRGGILAAVAAAYVVSSFIAYRHVRLSP